MQVIGVDTWNGTQAQLRSFKNTTGATYPLLLNGGLATGGNVEALYGTYDNYIVINKQGINVPNSFFWFTMDYVEFREDGTVWALMQWPPDVGSDIRLNKTAEYFLVGENQIKFVGACRHQDPCTGFYTATLKGNELQIFDAEGRLELKQVGPPSKDLPPTVVGPSPTSTP